MSRPTYGGELAAANNLLTTAHIRLHLDPDPRLSADVLALATAQRQLYRALYRQVVLIGGHRHSPLATNLGIATTRIAAIQTNVSATAAPAKPVSATAVALCEAADHALTATDILSSHIGPDATARTPDGVTLLAGLYRETNLAAVARLVVTAIRIDRELRLQLGAVDADTVQDPVARLVILNTRMGPGIPRDLIIVAEKTATDHVPPNTYLAGITAAPDVTGGNWPPVRDHPSFVDALDAVRAWLTQHHRHDLTGQHLRLMLGAGLALTTELANLANRRTGPLVINVGAEHATRQWRVAYLNTENLTTPGRDEPAAGPAALVAAEAWLRGQLRHRGTWRVKLPPAGDMPAHQWDLTAEALAVRLPDIATMLHRGASQSVIRGDIFTLTSPGHRNTAVHRPQWTAATIDTPQIARLLTTTHHLREDTMQLAHTIGADRLPGSFDSHLRAGGLPPATAALGAIADPGTAERGAADPPGDRIQPIQQAGLETSKPTRPLPPPTRASATPAIAALSEKVRRAERQGWATTTLPISAVRDLRDTINNLAADIARLHDHIRHELANPARPADDIATTPALETDPGAPDVKEADTAATPEPT